MGELWGDRRLPACQPAPEPLPRIHSALSSASGLGGDARGPVSEPAAVALDEARGGELDAAALDAIFGGASERGGACRHARPLAPPTPIHPPTSPCSAQVRDPGRPLPQGTTQGREGPSE